MTPFKGAVKISDTGSNSRKYVFAFGLGVIAGGSIMAYTTKAIPKMMAGMMQNMMTQMGGESCNPAEM